MFAVPGWSVPSSNLRTQTLQPSKVVLNSTAPANEAAEGAARPSKKRKRSGDKPQKLSVNSANFADLWESVIEKKPKKIKNSAATETISESVRNEHGKNRQKNPKGLEAKAEQRAGKDRLLGSSTLDPEADRNKLKTKKEKKREITALKQTNGLSTSTTSTDALEKPAKLPASGIPPSQLTPLQASMRQKLVSARFRHLNQTLYTTPSAHSLELFHQNPEMFQEYHEGFRRQVEVWPENPVDGYIKQIKARGKQRGPTKERSAPDTKDMEAISPLPRTEGTSNIADLGCGDAGLAQGLQMYSKKLKLRIYSYDLQSPGLLVTKADIANLPLEDNSIDVAILCLALMGTNWIDFIEEAFRILRWKGELWVAEIKSRFGRVDNRRVDHSVGNRSKKPDKKVLKMKEEALDEKDLEVQVDGREENKQETDVSAFVEVLRKRGFVLRGEPDLRNRMFVKMYFVKGLTPMKGKCVPVPKGMAEMGMETWKKKPKGKFIEEEVPVSSEANVLKPCVYKLR